MVWFFIWAVVIGAVAWFIMFKKKQGGENVAKLLEFAADNNFNVDYHYHAVLAIDSKTRSLILSSDSKNYNVYPTSSIISMERHDEGRNYLKWNIKFLTRSLENPRVFVRFDTPADRELWYDRIYALWNGGK